MKVVWKELTLAVDKLQRDRGMVWREEVSVLLEWSGQQPGKFMRKQDVGRLVVGCPLQIRAEIVIAARKVIQSFRTHSGM